MHHNQAVGVGDSWWVAGVLLHEAAHATSGRMDVTRDFEDELTRMLGSVAALALRRD